MSYLCALCGFLFLILGCLFAEKAASAAIKEKFFFAFVILLLAYASGVVSVLFFIAVILGVNT